jgi:uncharacterized membrane protein YraQ (UPF0718 family)
MGTSITFTALLQSGLGNLAAYLAAHVLLCLLPAFFIAGAMTALIPKIHNAISWAKQPQICFLSGGSGLRLIIGSLFMYYCASVCRDL